MKTRFMIDQVYEDQFYETRFIDQVNKTRFIKTR